MHLPHLVIEAVAARGGDASAQVVIESRRGHTEVVAASPAARALGIGAGLTLGAARARADVLEVVERSPQAERELLDALAVWSDGLTPLKCVEPPAGLLLEIGGSLKLLGGVDAIKAHVAAELDRRGSSGQTAVAPTPLGALWLARACRDDALSSDGLSGRIGALPVAVTAWPEQIQRLLAEMGITTLGECLRLPRAGFARRVGRQYLHDLDRATGRRADPRAGFAAAPRFEYRIDLPAETRDSTLIVEALRRLLDSLRGQLRTSQLQTGRVEIVLHHRDAAPTVHAFSPVRPVHRAERLLEPISLGLERLALPSACISVGLRAEALEPLRLDAPDLFECGAGRADADESAAALIENLKSRLGADEVHGLELVAEHRPERVWTSVDAGRAGAVRAAPVSPWVRRRPLWLLHEPLPLEHALTRFRFDRPLVLETGPERIEVGWWDGDDVRRDYYIAATPSGERLWTYRDRRTGRWHLHGIFA